MSTGPRLYYKGFGNKYFSHNFQSIVPKAIFIPLDMRIFGNLSNWGPILESYESFHMRSTWCDAKPVLYSAVWIGLRMISACDVERCVAKLTRALERNYNQLNWRFRIWCLKYKSQEIWKPEGQSPVKLFFRICSEISSNFLILILWYIVWCYGMFMKTWMNRRSEKWISTNVCWWRYANDQRRDSE